MPPSFELTYFVASSAPFVQFGPTSTWPPWVLIAPITTGESFGFALPAVPPTYFR